MTQKASSPLSWTRPGYQPSKHNCHYIEVREVKNLLHANNRDSIPKVDITHSVSGRHDVIVVHVFDERLNLTKKKIQLRTDITTYNNITCNSKPNHSSNLRTLCDLLVAHRFRDGEGVPLNTSEQSMPKLSLRRAFVEGFHHDRFFTSVATRQNDDNFSGLDEFSHLRILVTIMNYSDLNLSARHAAAVRIILY